MRTKLAVVALVLAVLVSTAAQAEVKLPSILSDNMVVQQGKKATFWGTAAPDEKINVKFAAESATATADKDGKWKVEIKPPAAGGPYEVTISGSNTITIKNVLVGEVWLCAGQSNMAFPLLHAAGGKEEVAAAN
jgi:sialate O-acetylesterase